MTKAMRFTVLVVAVACLMAISATSAYAYSGFYTRCQTCHSTRTGATVSAVMTTETASTITYAVTSTGATEWAVFSGYSRLGGGSGSSGSVTLPKGVTYEFFAVSGTPTTGTYGKASVSPAYSWPSAPGDVTAPVSSSNAVASYNNSAIVEFTATDAESGVAYIYVNVDDGGFRSTPVGPDGKAVVKVAPNTAGTSSHTIEFYAQDQMGNDETPQTVTFDIVRAAAAPSAAAGDPSVINPANGRSNWAYQDLYDTFEKYEGGYAAFAASTGWYADPHGGYDTATNKCKVCHAVHRAEGAYYLLRADSQDDACDYCHIGGSAHSSKVVYDLNAGGKSTTNGHTIGAATYIPDSTVDQWTEGVTLETVDADMNTLSETIEVRAYDEQKNDMYRFARHHGHSAATGAARRNYVPVGPLALRCMSCHQVHNAEAQTWQSIAMANLGEAGQYNAAGTSSYKLLKQFPSGTFFGATDTYGQISINNISIVPETTLTAGVNFDNLRTQVADPGVLALSRDFNNDGDTADSGETINMRRPVWVAQNFDGEHDRNEFLAEESIAASVNNAALSVWCADCHNLNIGGWEHLTNTELGFKAHTERTHPAPYTGAHSGPGQCYSCHRNDLPAINTGDTCSQCHYGTGNYKENRDTADAEFVASDFPHSGDGESIKMLGSYSIVRTDLSNSTVIDDTVAVTADNLDAVCIRCHGGIGTFH